MFEKKKKKKNDPETQYSMINGLDSVLQMSIGETFISRFIES